MNLISRATALGATRPELLTRVELRDEIVRLTETDEQQRQRARGWLGVARDLVASVVEQRLNLPDAADLIRGVNVRQPRVVPPVATVTLAEIYAAQGHVTRALKLLDEVLANEPDHEAARELRERLIAEAEPQSAPPSEVPDFQEDREELEENETADSNDGDIPESNVSVSNVPEAPPLDIPVTSVEMAEPEPKPEPDRDYLIYRRSDSNVLCHWSITDKTWGNGLARGDGHWVLRIVQVSPASGPLIPAETVVPLPGLTGEATLNDASERQQVRMAIGWDCGGRFNPVAIGIEVAGATPDDARIAWLPLPGLDEPAPEIWLDCARRAWRYLEMGGETNGG